METYGFKVNQEFSDEILSFCDNMNLDYQIWNGAEILLGADEPMELEFTKESDINQALAFYKQLQNCFA